MAFAIDLGGLSVGIRTAYEYVYEKCRSYLTGAAPSFTVETTPEMLAQECRTVRGMKRTAEQNEADLLYRLVARELPLYDAILFHGSAVACDGQGYMFTAPGGTGKSTHTRMWMGIDGHDIRMINDDKPIVRCIGQQIWICGSPWNGKHNLGMPGRVPLRAICALERGQTNQIRVMDYREMQPVLLYQGFCERDPAITASFIELLSKLRDQVRFYKLQCNMDTEAARVSFEMMTGQRMRGDIDETEEQRYYQ